MEDYNNYPQNNNQGLYNSHAPEQKSILKIWLLILIPVFVILIGVVLFIFMSSSSKTISENEFAQGINLHLKENKEAKFFVDNQEHTIKVNSINNDTVNLIIRSNPIQETIKIGETKKFDLNGDGFNDIQVKLNSIKNSVPEIYIKKIHESSCSENWNCAEWSSCSEQGSQKRICNDLNSCGTTANKPAQQQSCSYTCSENWSCISWSTCTNGQQTRTCTDSNSCGTTENKPSLTQSCTLQIVDCGINTRETIGNQPNFDCFIDASENCELAKILDISKIELFGMLITTSNNMELKGMKNNKCVYYQKTINQTIAFTNEMIQQMLAGGATQEEIDQQEQVANENAKSVWGLEKTCKFNKNDLTALLNNWKEGIYSSEDFNVAEC